MQQDFGTLTYYDEEENRFAALGHGIEDVDTGKLLDISNGELVTGKIVSIIKGTNKNAGEIRGIIDDGYEVGKVEKNTPIGVYGNVTNNYLINSVEYQSLEVASRDEIKIGKASIICELENGKTDEYEIEIKKIYKTNYSDNKSMYIKVIDDKLINITGGIIPGMSGTPIIQNREICRSYYKCLRKRSN